MLRRAAAYLPCNAAVKWPRASFTGTVGASYEAARSCASWPVTTWSDRWGQVASAGDNAAMESFFSLLQKNVLNRRHWATRDELRLAIITWIERTHHRRRRQAQLGRLTPIEYETTNTPQVALDA